MSDSYNSYTHNNVRLLFYILFLKKISFFVIKEPGREDTVSREVLWWDGVELAPPLPRQGLLAKLWETHQKKEQQQMSGDYCIHLLSYTSLHFYIRMTKIQKWFYEFLLYSK
jgi:hypothetical protein